MLRTGVHGVVIPVLDADNRQVGTVLNEDFDVLAQHGGAAVIQDNNASGELLGNDDDVRGCGSIALTGESQGGDVVCVASELCRQGDNGGFTEVFPCGRSHTVFRDACGTDACVLAPHGLNRDAVGRRNLNQRCRTVELYALDAYTVQAAQTLQRGEAPFFFTAGNGREVGKVVGGQAAGA